MCWHGNSLLVSKPCFFQFCVQVISKLHCSCGRPSKTGETPDPFPQLHLAS